MAKEKEKQGFVFDAIDLIKFSWNHKWLLITITIVAMLAAILISTYLIPKRYKSTVIMFPTASVSISKNLVETEIATSDTKDLLTFGDDEEAERLLQVLHSDRVRQHIIDKMDLAYHYDIDSINTRYPKTKLKAKFKENVSFRRTEFTSIEIEVLDEDPQMAADIANEIASYVDSVYFNMRLSRAQQAYDIVEREYNDNRVMLEEITDSLNTIRSYGISDFQTQSDALNAAYAEALIKNNMSAANKIKKQLDILNKYGSALIEMSNRQNWQIRRLSSLKSKYAAAKVNLEEAVTNVFVVDRAIPAEKKATPKRFTITVVTGFSTFALALLLLIILDNIKARK